LKAEEFTAKAGQIVSVDRHVTHGDKHANFANIATMWNAFLSVKSGEDLTAQDVGYMMALFKIARAQTGLLNEDDTIDAIGYLACAGEIATKAR
jgi:hypothetical protein